MMVNQYLTCLRCHQSVAHPVNSVKRIEVEAEYQVGIMDELSPEVAIFRKRDYLLPSLQKPKAKQRHVRCYDVHILAKVAKQMIQRQRRPYCIAVGRHMACDYYTLALGQYLTQSLYFCLLYYLGQHSVICMICKDTAIAL